MCAEPAAKHQDVAVPHGVEQVGPALDDWSVRHVDHAEGVRIRQAVAFGGRGDSTPQFAIAAEMRVVPRLLKFRDDQHVGKLAGELSHLLRADKPVLGLFLVTRSVLCQGQGHVRVDVE